MCGQINHATGLINVCVFLVYDNKASGPTGIKLSTHHADRCSVDFGGVLFRNSLLMSYVVQRSTGDTFGHK